MCQMNVATTEEMTVLTEAERDALLLAWKQTREAIEAFKPTVEREAELRKQIVAELFADKDDGTHYIELGNDWKLKAVLKTTYSLDKDAEKVKAAQIAIASIGNIGPAVSEVIFKWKPELATSEYKSLVDPKNDTEQQREIRKLVDPLVTTKPAMPDVSFVEPKAK